MRPRVVGAFLIGSALVLTAYTFSDFRTPETVTTNRTAQVNVVPTAAPVREFIPVQDSNGDGVPDWQEVLNDTEPITISAATSSYEAPDTLTDQFARNFFEGYVRDQGYGDFGSGPEALIANTSQDLQSRALDELYTYDDIIIDSDDSLLTLKAYGNLMALANLDNRIPVSTRHEVDIMDEAVATGDETILEELDIIINSYANIRDRVLAIPVPPRVAKEHLDYLNALEAIHNDIVGMRQAFSDPLYSLLRVKRYQDDVVGFYFTMVNLQNAILDAGVVYSPDEPAMQVIITQ